MVFAELKDGELAKLQMENNILQVRFEQQPSEKKQENSDPQIDNLYLYVIRSSSDLLLNKKY